MTVSETTGAESIRFNLVLPTFGGKQLWRDGFVCAGWRIQQNVWTGHWRLLNPKNWRHAWGTFDQCKTVFEARRANQDIQPSSRHLVIMLHGITRSPASFSRMKTVLRTAGFDAVGISYPSTRRTINEHANGLGELLERVKDADTVSFVTDSMGGLVLGKIFQNYVNGETSWRQRLEVGRIVMIAPPARGSVIAKFLKRNPLYRLLYGPAGQELTPDAAPFPLLPPGLDVAVIAGGLGNRRGFNPLLDGDDDWTVRVSETLLDGTEARLRVPTIHMLLARHPMTIEATCRFLRTGRLVAETHTDASPVKDLETCSPN